MMRYFVEPYASSTRSGTAQNERGKKSDGRVKKKEIDALKREGPAIPYPKAVKTIQRVITAAELVCE